MDQKAALITEVQQKREEGQFPCLKDAHRHVIMENDMKTLGSRFARVTLFFTPSSQRPSIASGDGETNTQHNVIATSYVRLLWCSAGYVVEIRHTTLTRDVISNLQPARPTSFSDYFNMRSYRYREVNVYRYDPAPQVGHVTNNKNRPFVAGMYYIPANQVHELK